MSIARVKALRSLRISLRHSGARATPRLSASARTQLAIGQRHASGGGHGHEAPSSDIPWLAGAIAVTIPSCWYLWPDSSQAEHHGEHGHHDVKHDNSQEKKEGGGEEEEADADEESGEKSGEESGGDDTSKEAEAAKESKESAKPSGAQGEAQPESSDANKESEPNDEAQSKDTPENQGNVEGVNFKGKVKEDAANDTRKSEPDAKGAYKKRIDSGLGKNLGEGSSDDEAATAKAPHDDSQGQMSGKQAGVSNTATRHSIKIDEDPSKSKKPEGPDTAKAVGTISPNRPQH